ncbi:MAG: FAD-dependent oxidoreductase [Acidimicrobiales bacterium]
MRAGAIFIDDPLLAAQNLAAAARRRGADFVFNRSVVGIDQHGGRVSGVTLSGKHSPLERAERAHPPLSARRLLEQGCEQSAASGAVA